MTANCRNCGAAVTGRYIRVFSQDGDGVDCCPRCPGRIRANGKWREAKVSRAVGDGGERV